MTLALEKKVTWSFALALLVILAVSGLAWRSNEKQLTDADWVAHTQDILTQLTALLSATSDGETGQRGFIISGDPAYLAPYDAFQRDWPEKFRALAGLVVDNPEQQADLGSLHELLEQRAGELAHVIQLRREQGFEAARARLVEGRGKHLQDEIREHIERLQGREQALLDTRRREASTEADATRLLLASAFGLSFIAIVVVMRQFGHEFSRRKEAEEALLDNNRHLAEATAKAERADRLKSAFLATMSHELRTPLNSIIGFSGILLGGLAGPLNAEQGKQLGMVRDSSRHLLALVNDILDLSKIEADELSIEQVAFAPAESIRKALAVVAPLAEKAGLTLDATVAPDLGQMVSDPRRFEQILINLLNNAIKFTEHGTVSLRAERIDGPALRVAVSDTGIGIRPEDLARLYQPFQQIDDGLARNREGTGLGLAITQRLLGLMGGSIAVASEFGRGSTFTLTLPTNEGSLP